MESITLGDWMVSGTAILATLATVVLVEVSLKLVKVTTLAANVEMSKVARTADHDMRDVALGYAPTNGAEGAQHPPAPETVTKH